jgi:heavy metal translocating P-type ATPase
MDALKKGELESKILFGFDIILAVFIVLFLFFYFTRFFLLPEPVFIALSFLGLLPVLRSAVLSLWRRKLTIDLLASIALVFAMLAKDWHSAAFINLMLIFARIFSFWTEMRAKDIIGHLLKYRPAKVKIKKGEEISEIPVERIKKGDLLVIESGDRIPADGVVVSGQASVNQSVLTGESEPVAKKEGSKVFSSTLNESGSLLVRAEKIGKDSTAEKIVSLIEEASREKSPSEQIAARFTGWYILLTFLGAIIIYLVFKNVQMVLAVLLVTCADDIAVAIPLAFTAAISFAARQGILIKGAGAVETLAKIKYFMTDKTGTLTFGKPKIKKIVIFSDDGEKEILQLFGTVEINSHHPSSQAIIKYLKEKGVEISAPDEFSEFPGDGISIVKNGKTFSVGKVRWLKEKGVGFGQRQLEKIDFIEKNGLSITALADEKNLLAVAVLADEPRPFAKSLVKSTRKLGVEHWVMLTGDNKKAAALVANELGIKTYQAELKPETKLEYIKEFKQGHKGTLAMIGDGVNDAAALALADVSIAMGVIGSDVSIEAADVALMKDDLHEIPVAMRLGKKTLGVVRQNFWLWGFINALGLLLVFAGFLTPVGAAAYNFLTDFLPILNALRIGVAKK